MNEWLSSRLSARGDIISDAGLSGENIIWSKSSVKQNQVPVKKEAGLRLHQTN